MSPGLPENGLHQMASLIGILLHYDITPCYLVDWGSPWFTHTLANGWTNCSPMTPLPQRSPSSRMATRSLGAGSSTR